LMAKRRAEPLVWLLFTSGGLVAALLFPVLLLLFGLVFPAGWASAPAQAHLLVVMRNPLTRIVLLGLCVLALFHWAHRFRYTLYDGLQLKHLSKLIIVGCYGGALVGSALAVYVLLIGLLAMADAWPSANVRRLVGEMPRSWSSSSAARLPH
jgi:fumarate reductase subunit D